MPDIPQLEKEKAMGCDNGPSFHNRNVYENGRWGCTWGSETTFEAPDRQLVIAQMQQYESIDPHEWEIKQDATGKWVATKVSQVDSPPFDLAAKVCGNGHSFTNWSDTYPTGRVRRNHEGWACRECKERRSELAYLSADSQYQLAGACMREILAELREKHPDQSDSELLERFGGIRDEIARRTLCIDDIATLLVLNAELEEKRRLGEFVYD